MAVRTVADVWTHAQLLSETVEGTGLRQVVRFLLILAVQVTATVTVTAADQLFKLTANDGAAGDNFGKHVDMDGGLAIVGAWTDDDRGFNSGSAYLFNASTGAQVRKLVASDGTSTDFFGSSVAIDNGRALIGATGDSVNGTNSGSAYVFNTTTGAQLAKFAAGGTSAEFGFSVALEGSTALIGARQSRINGADAGIAYLYNIVTQSQIARLSPLDPAPYDYFGISVALDTGKAIVGALEDDDHGNSSGSAYLFDAVTGAQLRKFTASDGAAGDSFGRAVAISNSIVLIGAPGDDDDGNDSGSAYLFDINTGMQIRKLRPNDGTAGSIFGDGVALSGNTALVSATFRNERGDFSGAAYLFDTATGVQLAKLVPNDGASGDWFGNSVALDGGKAIIGAMNDETSRGATGSAYLFDASVTFVPPPGDYNNNGVVDAADYVVWRTASGSLQSYETWRANFGRTSAGSTALNSSVPEPGQNLCCIVVFLVLLWRPTLRGN